ncbi:hypothetical protein P1X14_08240 [Sphingomonas sp. AOB5]|uniref:hypothetical protein n=1 Tax=Sphingomonas sp. AOB5 TaxID=3034017 RepID=UPI0023F89133|nr:hypothetical protein [Sphingomonas sp. AOB5]MDF7775232.1 hypothetical protein [Sphingomonas sp. AOB5]
MTTQYTIYLVNQSGTTWDFALFFAMPPELAGHPYVYGNSSVWMPVKPNYDGLLGFGIAESYVVAPDAGNQSVLEGSTIAPIVFVPTNLSQAWRATYFYLRPPVGPGLTALSTAVPPGSVSITTDICDPPARGNEDLCPSMSFGLDFELGFTGVTWLPVAGETVTITPKMDFLVVAMGRFESNQLTPLAELAQSSAAVSVPDSFAEGACTVTLLPDGTWSVVPGIVLGAHPARGEEPGSGGPAIMPASLE